MSIKRKKIARIHMSTRAKLIAILILVVCALALFSVRYIAVRRERIAVAQGVERLSEIDTQDALVAAESAVKKQRQDAITKMLKEASQGKSDFDPWSYFNDSAILGDSRAVGFYQFEFLPKTRVLAEPGKNVTTIQENYDDLKALNPSYIFLCYGINDIVGGKWKTGEDWAKDYEKEIVKLKGQFPKAKVCVNTVLPCNETAIKANPRTALTDEYNEALEKACKSAGVLYVACDNLQEDLAKLYEPDGIHFTISFYPYWAGEMIMAAYMGDDTTEDSGAQEEQTETAQEEQTETTQEEQTETTQEEQTEADGESGT